MCLILACCLLLEDLFQTIQLQYLYASLLHLYPLNLLLYSQFPIHSLIPVSHSQSLLTFPELEDHHLHFLSSFSSPPLHFIQCTHRKEK